GPRMGRRRRVPPRGRPDVRGHRRRQDRARRPPLAGAQLMFSGIVRDVGTVVGATPEGNGRRLFVRSALPGVGSDAVELGDSISVNGACLTVDALAPDGFEVVLGRETIDRTTLGGLAVGSRVNLERSLRLSDRLDGHLVA